MRQKKPEDTKKFFFAQRYEKTNLLKDKNFEEKIAKTTRKGKKLIAVLVLHGKLFKQKFHVTLNIRGFPTNFITFNLEFNNQFSIFI